MEKKDSTELTVVMNMSQTDDQPKKMRSKSMGLKLNQVDQYDVKDFKQYQHDRFRQQSLRIDTKKYEDKFRKSIAYWFPISFLEGSIMFIVASYFYAFPIKDSKLENSFDLLVGIPYLIGAIFYLIGSYLGWLGTINPTIESHKIRWFTMKKQYRTEGFYCCLYFVFGAIGWIICCVLFMMPQYSLESWIVATVASLCFVIGSLYESVCNYVYKWRPYKIAWWITWFNNCGTILFMAASLVGLIDDTLIFIPLSYLYGCVGYGVAAILALVAWKLKYWGVSYIPFLNFQEAEEVDTKEDHEFGQLFMIIIYTILNSISIYGLCIAPNCNLSSLKEHIFTFIVSFGLLYYNENIEGLAKEKRSASLEWFSRVMITFYLICYTYNLINDEKCF